MWCIADIDPSTAHKACAVIYKAGTDLVVITIFTQFYLQHDRPSGVKSVEDEMGIISCHRDRIRIEVEAHTVARLVGRAVISDKNGVVVIDQRLQSIVADQLCRGTYTQIAAVC